MRGGGGGVETDRQANRTDCVYVCERERERQREIERDRVKQRDRDRTRQTDRQA